MGLKVLLALLLVASIGSTFDLASAKEVQLGAQPDAKAEVWLESSLHRVYPSTVPGKDSLELLAARNSRIAFQVCARSEKVQVLYVEPKLQGADDLKPRIRFEGLVPVERFTADMADVEGVGHIPGLVPDPLMPWTKVNFGPMQSRAFWITLNIPTDAKPGLHEITVKVSLHTDDKQVKEQAVELPVKLTISPFVVKPRHDFPVVHWWRGEATWDYYHTGMFDDRWWKITHDQLTDMLDHGSNVIYVPILFDRRETFKRPCQLLIVKEPSPGRYEFDFSKVKQFTDMCKKIGFKQFEWSHLWIYWGVKNPMRIYTEKSPGNYQMLWPPDTDGFSEVYINFLKQYLPAWHDFMVKEKLLDCSWFHLSDEPGGGDIDRYRQARQILHELAPWMKTMDALSDIGYGKQHVTDFPIPMVSAAKAFTEAGIPHWVYFCCSPGGKWLNRFEDTPLTKIRMSGFLFYKLRARGFLHWGFNYWHKMEKEECVDPFLDTTGGGGVPAGDPFEIYPGADGKPIDSIRWEIFAQGLQDYAILQTAGINPDNELLRQIKGFNEFPHTEQWIEQTMQKILKMNPPQEADAQAR